MAELSDFSQMIQALLGNSQELTPNQRVQHGFEQIPGAVGPPSDPRLTLNQMSMTREPGGPLLSGQGTIPDQNTTNAVSDAYRKMWGIR